MPLFAIRLILKLIEPSEEPEAGAATFGLLHRMLSSMCDEVL
jgi:hypothetical protein